MKTWPDRQSLKIRHRIALALCAIATLATLLTLVLPRARLARDLEALRQERLDQAATASQQLLDDTLRRVAERHRSVSRTPEFRANLETADVATLAALARTLVRREESIDAVVFSNSGGERYASAGASRPLRAVASMDLGALRAGPDCQEPTSSRAKCRGVTGTGEPILLASDGDLVIGTSVALFTRGRFIGRVTLLEIQDSATLDGWSRLSGAKISLVPPEVPLGRYDRIARVAPPLELRIHGSFESEQLAVARLGDAIAYAGMLALIIAFGLTAPLSKSLLAPLREIEAAALRIREGDRSTRLRSLRRDEFGEVASALDTMLDHLEATQSGLERAQEIGRLGSWRYAEGDAFLTVSPQMRRILALSTGQETVDRASLFRQIHPDDRAAFEQAWSRCEQEGVPIALDHRVLRATGSPLMVRTRAERTPGSSDQILIEGTMQDVSEQRRAEEQIRALAYEDSLTGLGNRRAFAERLHESIADSRRELRPLGVIFLDLDDFKIVNDTLGHRVGDDLLSTVAEQLLCAIADLDPPPASASVHRLGGDEFAVLLPILEDLGTVHRCAEAILERLAEPVDLGAYEVSVSASIGIATWPDEGTDAESLLLGCDTAMYHAKLEGRGRFRTYDPSMRASSERRLSLESRMRQAIDQDEFDIAYQPKVDPEDGRIVGWEALLRWRDTDLGAVSPTEFVAVAEETGQILALGEWVLLRVARQAREWLDAGGLDTPIAVNVSSLQIESNTLPGTLDQALRESGLPPELLELEVTESALMRSEDRAVEILEKLKRTGVGLSLDDFGTGYSSLAYLRKLPIDTVKIDRTFVEDITSNPQDRALIESILSMAAILELDVVVEGVENEAQRDLLHELGCRIIQGYFYSPGVPAAEVPSLARRGFTGRSR